MNHRLTSAGLVATATLFAASAVFAAPQFRATGRAVSSQIVRTGAGDDQNAPSRHHRYDFRATQQMHTGGGGNSK